MDKKYIELFRNLAQATAVSAEQVMDYDRENDNEKGYKAAQTMRDNFQALTEKLSAAEDYQMTKVDAANLLVGAVITTQQLEDRINNIKKALADYQTEIIPKLKEIVDTETDEDAIKLANEKFILDDNK